MSHWPLFQDEWSAEDALHAAGGRLAAETDPAAAQPLAHDALIVLPIQDDVLFPGGVLPLTIEAEHPASIAGTREAVKNQLKVGCLLQREPGQVVVAPSDLYWVGTVGPIVRYVAGPNGNHHLAIRGQSRFRILHFLEGWPFLVARVVVVDEPAMDGPAVEARFLHRKERGLEPDELLPNVPEELGNVLQDIEAPGVLADMVANLIEVKSEEKQEILETFDLVRRLDKVLALLAGRIEVMRLAREISEKTRAEFDETQREHVLRAQLRQIQKALGEDEAGSTEVEDLRKAIEAAGMPDEALHQAGKDLRRLERMGDGGSEYAMLRTYLEWLTELPWKPAVQPPIDIGEARRILDEDHFGLDKVKRRILEYLAVKKLNPQGKSPILCFVGPPGVGKTSLGQSIARATGRVFQRIALGGVHDEAEIRGHRRTYIGALPGNIIQAMRRAGSTNVVLMLDEIDKLGSGGFHGDPANALLEVLDPEQNHKFRDNYLALDFDLSRVMFICTANLLDTIHGPLRDRMEIIQLSGYTAEEKLQIARRYLVRRQITASGLRAGQAAITDEALAAIIRDFTREAGVRNLEREIGAALRHVAMQFAEGRRLPVVVNAPDLPAILGPVRFQNELALRSSAPGVATGLAWTAAGGEILFIESRKVPGSDRLILTGQLGEIMKESAQAALTLAQTWTGDALEKINIHLHVPAGATPKDGPSAGVAMFVALVSLLTGRPVRPDVAMTGEISLRGVVMPVGGIKEKILAALRAGIRTVMLPRPNEQDVADVPPEVRQKLEFVYLDRVEDAVHGAIGELEPIPEPGTEWLGT